MKYYQVVGWYRGLPREFVGKNTTVSDGAMFSDPNVAETYARAQMNRWQIVEHEADALPQDVDFYLTAGIWSPDPCGATK